MAGHVTISVVITGGVSLTVTVKLHEAVVFCASVAVAVTVVGPTANNDPRAGLETTVTGATPPLDVGAGYTTATGRPSSETVV